MNERKLRTIRRRDFLKLAGIGAAALAATRLSGRLPSGSPAIGLAPQAISTWLPDGRQGFPARVFAAGGRILEIAPNPAHPLFAWYNPGAAESLLAAQEAAGGVNGPLLSYGARPGAARREVSWTAAQQSLSYIFQAYRPGEIAFVVGGFPDHLADLSQLLAGAMGGAAVLRLIPGSWADGRTALQDAAWQVFGQPRLPVFDFAQAGLVFDFGVLGDEPWVYPALASGARRPAQRWVHIDSQPAPAGIGGEWVRIQPGSHARAAQAISHGLLRLRQGMLPDALAGELGVFADPCGLEPQQLAELAVRFAASDRPLGLPGGRALAAEEGAFTARMVLGLNATAGPAGRPANVFLPVEAPLHPSLQAGSSSLDEITALVERIHSGQVKALVVHGADLIQSLPASLDVPGALAKLERLVSLDGRLEAINAFAGLLVPGCLPLEAQGYTRILAGAGRPLVAAVQPALASPFGRCSTVDMLLAAARQAGIHLPYQDEVDFIRKSLRMLPWRRGEDPQLRWQAQGGWWTEKPVLLPAVSLANSWQLMSDLDGAAMSL